MSQRIAIVGYGVEGESAYRYIRSTWADAAVTIFVDAALPKEPPTGVDVKAGDIAQADLRGYEIVFRSPSVRPDRIHTDGRVTSVTNEFLRVAGTNRVIGVTGSKGKGTTTSLIYEILKAAGITARLAGNIGVPALNLLPLKPDEWVILELSSFQLWDIEASPHIAVLLMMESDHLDVHTDMNEYIAAKANITAHQKADDILVYLPGNKFTAPTITQSVAHKIPFTQAPGAHVESDFITIDGQKIIAVSELGLVGGHHRDNACAAVTAAWQVTQDTEAMWRALSSFTGLPHRLQLVREVSGVKYYDDSIATTPGSAIAALRAFEQPKIIILGGSDKGADFHVLAHEIAASSMRHVILIGAMQDKIHAALSNAGINESLITMLGKASMATIVQTAHGIAKEGDAVIMSPACASFDMFKSYKDRGEQFITAVNQIS